MAPYAAKKEGGIAKKNKKGEEKNGPYRMRGNGGPPNDAGGRELNFNPLPLE